MDLATQQLLDKIENAFWTSMWLDKVLAPLTETWIEEVLSPLEDDLFPPPTVPVDAVG